MKLQTKLLLLSSAITAITFGVSFFGYWQVKKLGSALYEVGVVRLPSVEGLDLIRDARVTLDDSCRVVSLPDLDATALARELDRQKQAWVLLDKGWNLYEPLPQTEGEALKWQAFVPAAKNWRTNYEALVSLVAASRKSGGEPSLAKVESDNLANISGQSAGVGALLSALIATNYQVANVAIKQTVDSHQAMMRAQNVMLLAVVASVLGAIGCGIFIRQRIGKPIAQVAEGLARISYNDSSVSIPIRTHDEIGQMGQAFNDVMEKLRRRTTFFAALAESSVDGILVIDSQEKKLFQNKRLTEMWNIPQAFANDPDDRKQLEFVMDQVKNPGPFVERVKYLYAHPYEISRDEVKLNDGRVFDRYSSPVLDRSQNYHGRIWSFRDISERKQAEKERERLESQLRSAMEDAAIGMTLVTPDGLRLEVNPAFCKMFGYTHEELMGSKFQNLLHPDDMAASLESNRKMLSGELNIREVESRHIRYIHKDGHLVWTLVQVKLVHNADGSPRHFIAQVQDISERMQAEKALLETKEQLQYILDNTRDVIFQIDIKGNYIYGNAAAEQLTGYPVPQLLQMNMMQLVLPEYHALIKDRLQRRLERKVDETAVEFEIRRKDGRRIWIEQATSEVCNQERQLVAIQGVVRDITTRKQAESALKLSEEKFSKAFRHSPDAISITDFERGVYAEINDTFEKLYGYSRAEVIGHSPDELKIIRDPSIHEKISKALRDRGYVQEMELQAFNRKNEALILLHSAEVFELDGRKCVLRISRDITGKRALETQLRQSQKMEAIGQLAGGVAHDFNNFLAVIQMQAGLLAASEGLSADQIASANEIGDTVQRAASITRQLLLFSRQEVFQPRDLNLNQSIVNTTKMLERLLGENIQMQLKLAAQPMFINADAGMMDQVLVNLAVNARDAMPDGGRLVIETAGMKFDESAAAQSPQVRPGSFVRLSMSDTGSGIPPEILPKIFEPFFTTKGVGKGTGLGLATVFGIAQQHQGWIDVDSQVGKGTTFHIYLPQLVQREPAKPTQQSLTEMPVGHETILLVEDDPALRVAVRKILSKLGYQILEAPTGVKALEVWNENRREINLLLTDLVMPDGLNGKDLAQRLLQENPKLKVIYMSGYSADIVGKDFPLEEGFHFLNKPFQAAKLAQSVRAVLDE